MILRSRAINLVLAAILAGMALGGLVFLGFSPNSRIPASPFSGNTVTSPSVGSLAPDFELGSIDGDSLRLSDFRGRPVLINFWATWCGPCRLEMPAIQARYVQHQPELVVLAINFNEPLGEVREFVDELGLTFEVLLDPDGEINRQVYQVRGYPTTIMIDREGIIRVIHIGIMTESQLDTYLAELEVSR